MNILLGFILVFSLSLGQVAYVAPEVETTVPESAAEAAGLVAGDVIIRANGKRVHLTEDLSWVISTNREENRALNLTVKNNGTTRNVTLVPSELQGKLSYGIGLLTKKNNIASSLRNSYYKTAFYSGVVVESFVNLIKGKIPVSQMSGPIGIVSQIGSAVEDAQKTGWEGLEELLYLTILLTINLGIFNLLPLPALDGGRILFVLIEMIRRKPVPVEKEAIVHFIGFALLIALSIFVAFGDVIRLWG